MLQQRQAALLIGDIAEQLLHQARFHLATEPLGWGNDSLPQFIRGHRAEQALVAGQGRRQLQIEPTFAVEISTHGE